MGKLSEAEARDEIDALREGIECHDYLYYVKDRPEIPDETYDKLFRRLQELEEDISRNVRTIGAVPLHLRDGRQEIPSFLAVRGEVFMRKDDFQKLNRKRIESGEEPFANPRNAAAGSVRRLDPGKVAGIPLDIVFYDILDVRDSSFASQWAMLQQLPKWSLKTDPHNRKDVRPGDKVRIERAGDVIPEVVERVGEPKGKRGKPFSMPKNCPSCGAPVHREGAHYYCPNSLSCPGQLVGRISHFASRDAMDIAGLGRRTVKELVDKGMVRTLADLYRLSVDDLRQIEGFADKPARQLHDAIQRSKEVRMDRFLYALGIPRVGPHAVRALARHFRTVQALEKAGLEELAAVEDIGRETARSLHSFLRQKENRDVLHQLYRTGLRVKGMPSHEGAGPLEGKTFVFTGEVADHTRREAERIVESMGGRVASSVSGETDFVVAGDRPRSKLNEASDRGVKVINEKRFKKLVHS